MTKAPMARGIWMAAFPLATANDAVEAVCHSWKILASQPRPNFHKKSKEPHLTRVLKSHVEHVTAPSHGLLGMWAAENVINRVDFTTGDILEERRTDIVYGWNDQDQGYQLVMEFKKLSGKVSTRKHYLGDKGIGRFISGMYGHGQHVAVMVGLLIDSAGQILPKLCDDICSSFYLKTLCLQQNSTGKFVDQPSKLFAKAKFDTTHDRPPPAGPPAGKICVAHVFLEFGE